MFLQKKLCEGTAPLRHIVAAAPPEGRMKEKPQDLSRGVSTTQQMADAGGEEVRGAWLLGRQ